MFDINSFIYEMFPHLKWSLHTISVEWRWGLELCQSKSLSLFFSKLSLIKNKGCHLGAQLSLFWGWRHRKMSWCCSLRLVCVIQNCSYHWCWPETGQTNEMNLLGPVLMLERSIFISFFKHNTILILCPILSLVLPEDPSC